MTTDTARAYGYIRVSTVAQTLDRQMDALTAKGIDPDHIYSDKISGTKTSRPGLDELLRHIRPGDSLTVHSLDRLGRSALHVMSTIADLTERGIAVKSLKEGEDMAGASGKLISGIMILVSEWERSMNAERVAEARAAKAQRAEAGAQVAGRPRTAMTDKKVRQVRLLKSEGLSASEIADEVEMSRASVYRILAVLDKAQA